MSPTRFTDEVLDAARRRRDPVADEVIRALFDRGQLGAVNDLFRVLVANDSAAPEGLPAEAAGYFVATAPLPDWADPERIAIGEQVFMRHGVLGLVGLLCASLPECYALAKGVKVLGLTQRLGAHTRRRLYETAQLVVDVLSPGGLSPAGRGVRAAQKVRLMHAAIRYLVLADPANFPRHPGDVETFATVLGRTRWDPALGEPINQEDMAFTLLSFGWVIPRSWDKLGVQLTERERDAYLHTWNVVGHLLGLDASLICHSEAEANELFQRVRERNEGSTPEGRELTRALHETIVDVLQVPSLGRWIPPLLFRHLLDPRTADLLAVPEPNLVARYGLRVALWGFDKVTDIADLVEDELPPLERLNTWLGLRWVRALAAGGGPDVNRKLFHLPESLATAWKIPPRAPTVSRR